MTDLTDFSGWDAPAELVTCFRQTDREGRFLSDADLVVLALARLPGALPTAARQIREEAPLIVEQWCSLHPEADTALGLELLRGLHFAIANGRPDCFTPTPPTPLTAALVAVVRKRFPPEVQVAIAPVLVRLESGSAAATEACDHG